jgi:hypothetical protein
MLGLVTGLGKLKKVVDPKERETVNNFNFQKLLFNY